MPRTKTSLLFLTHNRLGAVMRCFHSLRWTLSEPGLEWVIVDNASEDGTAPWLQKLAERFTNVRVILRSDNLGVAGGRKLLLEQGQGQRLVFLDSDVMSADQRWLPDLLNAIKKPSIGVAGPSGSWLTDGWLWYEPAPSDYTGSVDVVSGYCQAFRRNVAERLEMDEKYNFYWHEDSDYCLQARALGLDIVQVPCPGLKHLFAGSGDDGMGAVKQAYLASKWRGKGLVRNEREEIPAG